MSWWPFRRRGARPGPGEGGESGEAPVPAAPEPDEPDEDDEVWEPEEIAFEITDVLDLHSFPPRDVPNLVRDYLDAAYEKGLREIRIIHGRGVGVQRKTVRTLLERDPRVVSFADAPAEAGGWGATVVTLE